MNIQIKNPIGELISTKLEELKLSTKEFSEILGVTNTYISSIANGNKIVSVELAFMISKILKIDPLEILNKQNEFELSKINSKVVNIEDKMYYSELWKKYKNVVPVKYFEKLELINGNVQEKIEKLNKIYGVNSTDEILRKVSNKSLQGFHRMSPKIKIDNKNILAWELVSKEIAKIIRIKDFDLSIFKKNISIITTELKLILTENINVVKRVKELLQNNGIKFELVQKFDKTPIDGFSFKSGNNPTIIMTLRYKRLDNFAFTLFHELGHIYSDYDAMETIDFIESDARHIKDDYEQRADKFANQYLYGSELIEILQNMYIIDDDKLKYLRNMFNLNEVIILGAYKFIHEKYRIKTEFENKIG